MNDRAAEWLRQADYDWDTAQFMLEGDRYIYAVFMCHLAAEKALKGLLHAKLNQLPPKTHNLLYLLSETAAPASVQQRDFLAKLSQANIATRYPDDLAAIQHQYTEEITRQIVTDTQEVLRWIKTQC